MNYNRLDFVKYYDRSDGSLLLPSEALSNCRLRLIPVGDQWLISEIMACDRPKFNSGDYGLLGTVRRAKRDVDDPLTPDEQKEYIDRSKRRARKAVRDLMDSNDFEFFMTFTLDEKIVGDRTDYASFIKHVNTYLDNRVRRCGWMYVAVIEYHKRKESNGKHALHLHAAVSGDSFKLSDSGTVVNPRGGKPITRRYARSLGYKDDELRTVYNVDDWKLGFSTAIRTYGKRHSLAQYITKYITKSDEKVGGRWYYSGGDLSRPLYLVTEVEYNELENDIEFDSGFGSFRIRYFDHLNEGGLTLDRLEDLRGFRRD